MYCTYFGIDSHLRTTTVCALTPPNGEVRIHAFRGNDYGEMREWMAGFPQPAYGAYESGRTGFVPARELTSGGVLIEPRRRAPSMSTEHRSSAALPAPGRAQDVR